MNKKVVWAACSVCGREWPFPFPDAPCSDQRDWRCHPCLNADYAKLTRELAALMGARVPHPEHPDEDTIKS